MLNMALYEWGLVNSQESLSKVTAIRRLNDFAIDQLAKGGNVVLIVDEAQNLDNTVMENLRVLSNLETRIHKLVQIVLSGQPELEAKLDRYELRQFAQRINLRRLIFPLDETHTYRYLAHRLKIAKHSGSSPFTLKARQMIWEYSGGIPRKINMLCDNALLIGCGLRQKKINVDMVQEAARDLKWSRFSDIQASSHVSYAEPSGFTQVEAKPLRRSFTLTATMILVGILILTVGFFLNTEEFQLARLSNFFTGIKGGELKSAQPRQAKAQVQVSRSDIPEHKIMEPKPVGQTVPLQNLESESLAKYTEASCLDISKYHLVKQIISDRIVQSYEIENVWQGRTLNETDHSKVGVEEKKETGLAEFVKKEATLRRVKIKKGDTLHRIIVQNYGAYDDVILTKVQKQNPKIIDPNLILTGQVIKLPVTRGQLSEIRGQR
jgi:general secretion pathway protein A